MIRAASGNMGGPVSLGRSTLIATAMCHALRDDSIASALIFPWEFVKGAVSLCDRLFSSAGPAKTVRETRTFSQEHSAKNTQDA
jgi:hypothetical protein